jgi:hypothetical protein
MTASLRQAAQMALNALILNNNEWKEFADSGDSGNWKAEDQGHYMETAEAIESLRAALAVPDEPSMTVAFDEGVKEPRIVSWNKHPTGTHWLYSIPQAVPVERQPLTADEIHWWWGSENGLEDCRMTKLTEFTDVIRAVEAKHGIRGAA